MTTPTPKTPVADPFSKSPPAQISHTGSPSARRDCSCCGAAGLGLRAPRRERCRQDTGTHRQPDRVRWRSLLEGDLYLRKRETWQSPPRITSQLLFVLA